MAKDVKPIKNKPQIISIQVLPGRVVKLRWSDAVGADKYVIKRYDTVDGELVSKKLEVLTNEFNEYKDTTIEADGLYSYRVFALKKIAPKENFKLYTPRVEVNIVSVDAPILDEISADGNKIRISWKKDEDVASYVVQRRFSFMKKAIPVAELSDGENEYTDKKFAKGQLMYYRIQSVYNNGDSFIYSKPSNELCYAILDKVKILSHRKKLGKKVYFKVRLVAGADGYILYRRYDNETEAVEVMRTEGISAMTISDLSKKTGKTAYYTVSAYKLSPEGREFIGKPSDETIVKF